MPPSNDTQRAYTMRLMPLRGDAISEQQWRDLLWRTHEVVNRGAQVFGDFMLTMRGGLPANLVGQETDPIKLKQYRVALAVSWLSVEAGAGAHDDLKPYVVAESTDAEIKAKVGKMFAQLLTLKGVAAEDIPAWKNDCLPCLEAKIRDDAVWVNRAQAFVDLAQSVKPTPMTEADAYRMVRSILGKDNFDTYALANEKEGDSEGLNYVQIAGNWLSTNFGTGKKADKGQIVTKLRALADTLDTIAPDTLALDALRTLCQQVDLAVSGSQPDLYERLLKFMGWVGRPSKGKMALDKVFGPDSAAQMSALALTTCVTKLREDAEATADKAVTKARYSWADAILGILQKRIGVSYHQVQSSNHAEYSVMFDHGLRKVSVAHSWIKLAEQNRDKHREAADKLAALPPDVFKTLEAYCAARSILSGATDGGYRIRTAALGGWDEVVKRWTSGDCRTTEQRIMAVRDIQAADVVEKWGDGLLFEALADDDYAVVWRNEKGAPTPEYLKDYVKGKHAQWKSREYKVPAYRHPDPYRHPVYVDYGNSRFSVDFAIYALNKGKRVKARLPEQVDVTVFDGEKFLSLPLTWHAKRMQKELGLGKQPAGTAKSVVRGHRLAGAAQGAYSVEGLFNSDWNSRLQVKRSKLDHLDRLRRQGKHDLVRKFQQRLPWFLTMSPKFQKAPDPFKSTPWVDAYQQTQARFKDRKGAMAKARYAGIPGLRVMGVDLGHRYAAACAVWQSLAPGAVKTICAQHGQTPPTEADLFLHIPIPQTHRKLILRRIGPDTLPDGHPHPAPWAQLERQFLIKLQGEERSPRQALPAELHLYADLNRAVGYIPTDTEAQTGNPDVAELQDRALRIYRLALQRHGRLARIVDGLTGKHKDTPGGRTQEIDNLPAHLQEQAEQWSALVLGQRWRDEPLLALWTHYLGKPLELQAHDVMLTPAEVEYSPAEQREVLAERITDKLKRAGTTLAHRDRTIMLADLRKLWSQNDAALKPWAKRLRRWLLPRCGDISASPKEIRAVGGLSLPRIANLQALYRASKAWSGRPTLEQPRGVPPVLAYGQRILDALERLRDQRLKQLASRIAEAALGYGSEKLDPLHPVRHQTPCFPACQLVVVENLENYRPEETRTRRENRQLMTWAAHNLKKHLSDQLALYGVGMYEISPAYTSRQCSRTGQPGVRASAVSAWELTQTPFWRQQIVAAQSATKSLTPAQSYLLHIAPLAAAIAPGKLRTAWFLIPRRGGELFLSSQEGPRSATGNVAALQADLNAAANIALKALTDPDLPAAWWRVPCSLQDGKPLPDKVLGAALFANSAPLTEATGKTGKGSIVNLWRWPTQIAPMTLERDQWLRFDQFWPQVELSCYKKLHYSLEPPTPF
ncbi:MAG: type V CRISPR-associated protein Cas12b [Phycisphaerae bacterium]